MTSYSRIGFPPDPDLRSYHAHAAALARDNSSTLPLLLDFFLSMDKLEEEEEEGGGGGGIRKVCPERVFEIEYVEI